MTPPARRGWKKMSEICREPAAAIAALTPQLPPRPKQIPSSSTCRVSGRRWRPSTANPANRLARPGRFAGTRPRRSTREHRSADAARNSRPGDDRQVRATWPASDSSSILRCISRSCSSMALMALGEADASGACGGLRLRSGGGERIEHVHGVGEHRHVLLHLLLDRLERIGTPQVLRNWSRNFSCSRVSCSSDISR